MSLDFALEIHILRITIRAPSVSIYRSLIDREEVSRYRAHQNDERTRVSQILLHYYIFIGSYHNGVLRIVCEKYYIICFPQIRHSRNIYNILD